MYFIQENSEKAILNVIKEGLNDIPVIVTIETQPLEAKGRRRWIWGGLQGSSTARGRGRHSCGEEGQAAERRWHPQC